MVRRKGSGKPAKLSSTLEREIWRSYFNRTDKAVFLLDGQLMVQAVNQYGCQVLKTTETELIGTDFVDLLVEETQRAKIKDQLMRLYTDTTQIPMKNIFALSLGSGHMSHPFSWRHLGVKEIRTNNVYILLVGEDISEQQATAALVNRRNAILEALTIAADHFLLATPEVWETNVIEVLKKMGEARGSDRVYLVKNRTLADGQTGLFLKYEWKRTGEWHVFEGEEAVVVAYAAVGLTRWAQVFAQRGVMCEEVGMFSQTEKQWNVAPEAKSLVLIPVFIDNEWWGYWGFEDWQESKECAPAEMEALKTLALLFGTAIKRKRMEEELTQEKVSVEARVQLRTRELKEAQEQVSTTLERQREEKARLTASIHSLGLGFVMTNTAGDVLLFNHAVNDILGRSDVPWSLSLLQERVGEGANLWQLINQSVNEVKELQVDEVLAGDKYVRINVTPIKMVEADGRVIGTVILLADITEAKQLQRSRDEFFAVASHELRTPLTAIKGNVAMLQHYYPKIQDNPDVKRMLEDVYTSSARLIEMVNENLDLSRLELKRVEIKRERIDILGITRSVMVELAANAKEKGLTWDLQVESQREIWANGDKERAEQVLMNLLGNAIKYTDAGGVYVRVVSEGTAVCVKVYDTGSGIGMEEQSSLFQKFKRLGDRVYERDVSQGTGMGLYISRLLAEAMGGKVYLEKSTPSVGSAFVFSLPSAG